MNISMPTGVCPFVNLEVLTPSEHFAASWERTGKWFLACVDSDVVDQFVFGLEWLHISGTILPQTSMVGLFRSPYMLYSQVSHCFMHGAKGFAARFFRFRLIRIYP